MSDEGLRAALEALATEWSERSTGYGEYRELRALLAAHPPTRICGDRCRSFGVDLICRMPTGHDGEHNAADGATWTYHLDADPNELRGAYLPADTPRGGDRDEQGLGLVTSKPLAGGKGTPEHCKYCDQIGGHTSDCPVIS